MCAGGRLGRGFETANLCWHSPPNRPWVVSTVMRPFQSAGLVITRGVACMAM